MVIRQAVRLISDMLESVTDDAYFEARQIVSEISGGKCFRLFGYYFPVFCHFGTVLVGNLHLFPGHAKFTTVKHCIIGNQPGHAVTFITATSSMRSKLGNTISEA